MPAAEKRAKIEELIRNFKKETEAARRGGLDIFNDVSGASGETLWEEEGEDKMSTWESDGAEWMPKEMLSPLRDSPGGISLHYPNRRDSSRPPSLLAAMPPKQSKEPPFLHPSGGVA
uniref:Uncharacterized protein n=1 Tax=Chromera velia CCMP2878 TaxID=1169474 RepID=A0A0G4FZA1_9ALVE|eukprot:Cvel_19375.t1-p1 / transcript=Cvel_19375.t1 / gene=Cvel_19375 / organism=Chromera_velia_CCMP2878 / gene_product=hypothetical protein / transcript_product=hypothetical protein / location=Cvel_scaffold1666:2376-3457(+) / protein_length=116 / sequence_SO=supercontig / SO=protein_coding / is_pseudo=false